MSRPTYNLAKAEIELARLMDELAEKDGKIATREEQLKAAYAEIDNVKYLWQKDIDEVDRANNRTEYVTAKKDAEIERLTSAAESFSRKIAGLPR